MKALIIVDVQHDFLPGGALAVPHGDEVIPYIEEIAQHYDVVVTTQDMHPSDHCSFVEYGGQWPAHCVRATVGSMLHDDIKLLCADIKIFKGRARDKDAYSGFDGASAQGNSLHDFLDGVVDEVTVVGLATDYCVRATAEDARDLGYRVTVDLKGCRGIDPQAVREWVQTAHGIEFRGE